MTSRYPDDYNSETMRSNRTRLDYVTRRIEEWAQKLDPNFCGNVEIKWPVLKGRLGKIRFTTEDCQPE